MELSIATEAGIPFADDTGDLQVMAASKERARRLALFPMQNLALFQMQNAEGPCQECFTSTISALPSSTANSPQPTSTDDTEPEPRWRRR